MTIPKMSKAVARELAIGFRGAVVDFIERNKDKYIQWLKTNNLTDKQFYNPNTEADK